MEDEHMIRALELDLMHLTVDTGGCY